MMPDRSSRWKSSLILKALPWAAFALFAMGTAAVNGALASPGSLDGPGERRAYHRETGRLSFLGFDPGHAPDVAQARASRPGSEARARAFLQVYGREFGLSDPGRELRLARTSHAPDSHPSARFQQLHQGVPVLGGELLVNTGDDGDLQSISGEISPDLSVATDPQVSVQSALASAIQVVAKSHQVDASDLEADPPELWIFDERLLLPSDRPTELVWRTEVRSTGSAPIRELVLVNAVHGGISLHFNQVDTAWAARPPLQETETPTEMPSDTPTGTATETPSPAATDTATETPTDTPSPVATDTPTPSETPTVSATPSETPSPTSTMTSTSTLVPTPTPTPSIRTFTANNDILLPGTFLCDETQPDCTNGADLHADAAHRFARDTYDFYAAHHGRLSLDDVGSTILSSVHYWSGYANSFWSGSQAVYGDGAGFALADDMVAHELSHGVTQYEANLFYYYQSGALNESLSDIWGEFVDLTNGAGNDNPGVRWLIGEDISGLGAIRSMRNPPAYGDPDRITSSLYYRGSADDYYGSGDAGGVHTNSGVNDKAAYLLTDGGTFNGYTVGGLGIDKVAAIYYEAQTNLLTSGADYLDLYHALYQACLNVIGGVEGITAGDCLEVRDATNAVEMHLQPSAGYNPEPNLCPAGTTLDQSLFDDDLESGFANWTSGALTGSSRWGADSPYGAYARSGVHFLYGDDAPEEVSDSFVGTLSDVLLPSGAYLHFAHAFGFEDPNWDGGVLEYTKNGGATWLDAGALFSEGRGYGGTVFNSLGAWWGNPLGGRRAFIGDSHGYVASRYNLSSLAGQSVRFRWRMGTDGFVYDWGWFVDDVRIYTCVGAAGVPSLVSPASGALVTSYTPVLDWADAANADHYQVQIATNNTFTSLVQETDAPGSSYLVSPALNPNTTYYWRLRTINALGQVSAWSAVRTFRTALLPPAGLGSADAGLTTRPTFDWENVAGASSYAIQVSTVNTFATMVVNATTTPSEYTPAIDLPRNVQTFWRVRANATNGPSDWTYGAGFVGANPPSVPALLTPANNALVSLSFDNDTGYVVTDLRWAEVPSPADHYQVQVALDSAFASIVDDATVPWYGYSTSVGYLTQVLEPASKYWWRVRSFNASGQYSLWSAARTFRTPMVAPTLVAPVDGAETPNRRPTFDWSDVAGATSYTLQVSTNNLFLTFVVNVNPVSSAYTMAADLPLNKVLDWRVRANGPNGPSAWSPIWSLLVVP